ncbi:hypothetical protein F5B20DRAFT_585704 [Whalleya microplaca]|nr:hypothetical protein F5B20DRAFT_585704 [Whalleya microplaca]
MPQSYGGGLPVVDSSSFSAFGPRPNCTTQSTGGSADSAHIDSSYYISPPAQKITEPPHPQHYHQPHPSTRPISINTSLQAYQHPQIHSAPPSTQGIWATPPSTTYECEEFDGFSYHSSPAAGTQGTQGTQPTHPCSARSSVPSPTSWSSPGGQQPGFQQAVIKEPDHLQQLDLQHIASLHHYGPQFHPQLATSPYENSDFGGKILGTEPMIQQAAPPMIPDFSEPEPTMSPHEESPQVKEETGTSYGFGGDEERSSTRKREPSDGDGGSKDDEPPYAQLIHKAFMSRERHAMTLQDIYQWFREHTEKGKSENKGWQNSIRHNLSMNAAFVKRDRKPSPGDPLTSSGETKKSTEWVLEDWAVHGVQSTTRYRKGTSGRRGGPGSHSRATNLSARASSGRKGGITASRTKAAATRRAILNRSASSYLSSQGQLQGNIYDHQLPFQYHDNVRDVPMTTAEPGAGDMILPGPLPSNGLPVNDNTQNYSYGNNLNYTESQHGYPPPEAMYPLGAVAGLYHGHPAPSSGRCQVPATGEMHQLFGNAGVNRVPFPYWDGAAGGHYQS